VQCDSDSAVNDHKKPVLMQNLKDRACKTHISFGSTLVFCCPVVGRRPYKDETICLLLIGFFVLFLDGLAICTPVITTANLGR
jgi:hypothetical protein